MNSFTVTINKRPRNVVCHPGTPLLWVLRDVIGLTGTKYGCGRGLCGACTVHLDGEAVRSCMVPVDSVGKAKVTTIEGLSDGTLHPVQQAWIDEQVPQCGHCQGLRRRLATWLEIGSDDVVTVFVPRSELGQGVTTAVVEPQPLHDLLR